MFLARRDYARQELIRRLERKGIPESVATEVVDRLAAEGTQSDHRFTEVYLNSAVSRGHGAIRIRAALRERGVDETLIDEYLRHRDTDWVAELHRVRRKRFGTARPADAREWAKQARFLQYRGFSPEQIRRALNQEFDEE